VTDGESEDGDCDEVMYETLAGSCAAVSVGSCESDEECFCESMADIAVSVAADSC